MTITRKDYMDGKASHREYFSQFITEGYPQLIADRIGGERLLNSKDKHLNDIPLKEWDRMSIPHGTSEKLKACGTYLTQSDIVCIAKEGARQYIEKHKALDSKE